MTESAVVARLISPNNADPSSNIHRGTTLKLMEETGNIVATQHMSNMQASIDNGGNCMAALICFKTMTFHKPIYVGKVTSCQCKAVFTSLKSILVEVVVSAENVAKGESQITNTGLLWYVPMIPDPNGVDVEKKEWKSAVVAEGVPRIFQKGEAALKRYEMAKQKYEQQTKSMSSGELKSDADQVQREEDKGFDMFKSKYVEPSDGCTLTESEQILSQIVIQGDCDRSGVAFGGFVMNLMDYTAGCSAWQHCQTNVVTVAISNIDFVSWVRLGNLTTIKSKVVFASKNQVISKYRPRWSHQQSKKRQLLHWASIYL